MLTDKMTIESLFCQAPGNEDEAAQRLKSR
jgi:hypothetical protein